MTIAITVILVVVSIIGVWMVIRDVRKSRATVIVEHRRPERYGTARVKNGIAFLLYPTREEDNRKWYACIVTDERVYFDVIDESAIQELL